MRLNKLITSFLIISILMLAGCAEKECGTRADCTDRGKCFIASCVKKECQYTLRAGCTCGDDECKEEDNENPCTCKEDCGECKGKEGDLMEKKCIDKECISIVIGQKEKAVEDEIKYEEYRQTKLQLNLKAAFDDPFDVKASLMKINIKIDNIVSGVSDVKITKLKITQHTGTKDRRGQWINDEPITITERTYTKILYDETSGFEKELPLFIEDLDPKKSHNKTLSLEVSYELKLLDRYGNLVPKQGTFEKEIDMILVSPSGEPKCPASCDDKNLCTTDTCGEKTNFFCEHEVISGRVCCGDDVCSAGEDKCKCSQDCGQCTGNVGDYTMMGCKKPENICTFQIINPNLVQSTSKLTDVDFSGAALSLKIEYDSPFDKSRSIFKFIFEPRTYEDVRNVVLRKIALLDKGGTVLGESILSAPIYEGTTTSTTATSMLTYKSLEAEETKTVSVKFDYTYDEQDRSGEWTTGLFGSHSYSLGELTILNPG